MFPYGDPLGGASMVKISCGSPPGEEEFSRFLINNDPAHTAKYHGTPMRIQEYPARGSSVHVNPFHGEVFPGFSYGIPLGGASIIRTSYGDPLGEEAFPDFLMRIASTHTAEY